MRIANIIATGTEVTSGQIVNSNAAWIAQKLLNCNFEIQRHLAIDDDNDRILESFKLCHKSADLIVVTGGLGPTTDDLTRKLVSDWAGVELVFDEKEWKRIQERLAKNEVKAREGHKWQAYMPSGCEVFRNSAGTASGFSLEVELEGKKSTFWFLPGPPYEIKAIWKEHLEDKLLKISSVKSTQLVSWQFIDLAESELANTAEELLGKLGYVIGYRASPPLVELKVWMPESVDADAIPEFRKLELTLKDHIHYKNNLDPMNIFFESLFDKNKKINFYIQDEITEGELLGRIQNLKEKYPEGYSNMKLFYSNAELKNLGYPFLKVNQTGDDSFSYVYQISESLKFENEIFFARKISKLRQKKWVCEKLFSELNSLEN